MLRRLSAALLVLATVLASPTGLWAPMEADCDCRCSEKAGCPMCKGHHHNVSDEAGTPVRCGCAFRATPGPGGEVVVAFFVPDPGLLASDVPAPRPPRVAAVPRTLSRPADRAIAPPRPRPKSSPVVTETT